MIDYLKIMASWNDDSTLWARFGFELIDNLAKQYGCEILVMNREELSPQQEMVEDLMSIIHTFSCKLSGLRKYKG